MKFWQKEGDTTTAVMKFYGVISQWWNGADDFTNTIQEIESKYLNLEIKLHCYGGVVFEGNVIFNALQNTKLNVTVCIDGIAASMGSIIMLPAKKICMAQNAFVMVHAPSGYTEGGSKDHFSTGNLLKKMEANAAKAYMQRTGMKLSDILSKWFDGTDHWFNADECKEMGLIDVICGPVDDGSDNTDKPIPGASIEEIAARYTALSKTDKSTFNKNNTMDKNLIISKFSLTGVSSESSDTAVMDALVTSVAAKDTRIKQLEQNEKTIVKATATSMIEARAKELNTTFTDEQKNGFVAVAENAGIETLQTVLQAMKGTVNVTSMILPENKGNGNNQNPAASSDERTKWTWDEYQEKDPEALNNLPKEQFDKLYLAKYPNGSKDLT